MIERQDIKTAIDMVDQWDDAQAGHVAAILMRCGNDIAALKSENEELKESVECLTSTNEFLTGKREENILLKAAVKALREENASLLRLVADCRA